MRVRGVILPKSKSLFIALTRLYGIGVPSAQLICQRVGLDKDVKVSQLDEAQEKKILEVVDSGFVIEGDLRKKVAMDIKRLVDLGCYRGVRHRRGLPVRGQNTKNNARTRKGRSRIPVAGKKKAV